MFACLDIETTGLNPKEDQIIEVAIVIFDKEKIIKEWSSLVKCPVRLPEFTKRLTGITDEMLKDAPLLSEIEVEIREIIGDFPIVGHFIFFDVNFLAEKKISLQNRQLDTCQLAQCFLPNEKSYSLEVLVNKLGIKHESAHRALDDVKANIELFFRLGKHISAMSKDEKFAIFPILNKSKWPWAELILEFLEEKNGEKIESENIKNYFSYEKHADLKSLTKNYKSDFLLQEASHTNQDILDFAICLDKPSIIVVSDLNKFPDHNEISKLKDANQYLNAERLENFINRDSLDISETMLALKIKLWGMRTKTGDKSEIKLVKEEIGLWNDICCQEDDSTSFYKKILEESSKKKACVIDQVHFLRDRARSEPVLNISENLIVAQTEEMPENVEYAWKIILNEKKFADDLRRLKLENPSSDLIIEHFGSKISILFGLIGIFIQNKGETSDFRRSLILENHHKNGSEWTKVKDAADSLESGIPAIISKLKDSGSRKSFEKYVNFFCKIIKNEGMTTWMNLDRHEQPSIFTFPKNPKKIFAESIWKNVKNLMLFCHHGNLGDDFNYLKKELSLPEKITLKQIESIEPLPIYYPESNISSPNSEKNVSETCHEISQQLKTVEGDFFLLVNSMAMAEQFFYHLEKVKKEHGRQLFVQNMGGGLGKILKMSGKTFGKNIYVGNQDLLQFLIDEGVKISFLAIHRLPFSYPGDPIQIAKAKDYVDNYKEFVLPQAALKFQKILNIFLGNEWREKKILILDPRIKEYESMFIG